MASTDNREEAVELLQQLGLKEYEAKCFVGLSRMSSGTAKDLGQVTEVPRTRVYDAIRVLEAQGLVEIQHTSPKRFRAVPLEEAMDTFESQFQSRIERLRTALRAVEQVDTAEEPLSQEVWALSGSDAIESRTSQLMEDATHEIVLVLGHRALLTDELFETVNALPDSLVVIIGTVNERMRDSVAEAIPDAEVFVSGLEWLDEDGNGASDTAIGRILLVDQETLLVSSFEPKNGVERAIFGRGFGNGLIVITRRLMETGLFPGADMMSR